MKSRMEKYYNNTEQYEKRITRNQEVYKKVSSEDIEKYPVNSNASIIKDEVNNINIDELKKMLDQKYNHPVQRKSIFIEQEEEKAPEDTIITKEYDINTILAKARDEKEPSYEDNRYKKISNTQYDILKNLNFESKKMVAEDSEENEEEALMTLINTITAKELEKTGELDPLDILSDLKGAENTEIIPPMTGAEEPVSQTKSEEKTGKLDQSFFTTSTNFTQSDFDYIEEFKEDKTKSKAIIWIFVTISIIAFVIGLVILANKYFDLGLF